MQQLNAITSAINYWTLVCEICRAKICLDRYSLGRETMPCTGPIAHAHQFAKLFPVMECLRRDWPEFCECFIGPAEVSKLLGRNLQMLPAALWHWKSHGSKIVALSATEQTHLNARPIPYIEWSNFPRNWQSFGLILEVPIVHQLRSYKTILVNRMDIACGSTVKQVWEIRAFADAEFSAPKIDIWQCLDADAPEKTLPRAINDAYALLESAGEPCLTVYLPEQNDRMMIKEAARFYSREYFNSPAEGARKEQMVDYVLRFFDWLDKARPDWRTLAIPYPPNAIWRGATLWSATNLSVGKIQKTPPTIAASYPHF